MMMMSNEFSAMPLSPAGRGARIVAVRGAYGRNRRSRLPHPTETTPSSHDHHYRIFDQRLERVEQHGAERAVNGAMVGGEPDRHHVRSLDLAVAHDRALLSGSDRENGRVRWIDNGVEFLDPIHAEVRYRASAALIFLRCQLAGTRAGGKVLHLVGNDGERFLLGMAQDRRDQSARYRHGDADVGMLV